MILHIMMQYQSLKDVQQAQTTSINNIKGTVLVYNKLVIFCMLAVFNQNQHTRVNLR